MDFTRFLWLSDITNPAGELATYRFKLVPFGTTNSPFMLNATLDLHLSKFSSPVASDMKANLYADNLISGCSSEDEVIDYYKQARSIMGRAVFTYVHGHQTVALSVQSLHKTTLMIPTQMLGSLVILALTC